MHTNACLLYAYPGSIRAVIYFIPWFPLFVTSIPWIFLDASSAWIGKDFADLLALSIAMRVYFYASTKEGSYVAFFDFSSNISLLKWHERERTWHRLTSTTYCPRRSRWFYFSAIFFLSRRRQRRPVHAFARQLLYILLALPLVLLWVWLTLIFQEKNGSVACLFFLVFFLSRLARGYDTDTFASICTWYNELVPVNLENELINPFIIMLVCKSYHGLLNSFGHFSYILGSVKSTLEGFHRKIR